MEQNFSPTKERPETCDVLILDPTSPEVNRGSFCYLPYILYNYYLSSGHDVWFEENFTVTDIDLLPKAKITYVALWSYPQIELCLMLEKFLPTKPYFFGYYPLIKKLGLRESVATDYKIKAGMKYYPHNYHRLEYLTLSDCDMHLKAYKGKVYPLFTSYGCPRGCSFCPSTVNTNRKRISLSVDEVEVMLMRCHRYGFKNIHFTDEDFFYNVERTWKILKIAKKLGGFNFIALGEVATVSRFIKHFGDTFLDDAGIRLIEIGLETADPDLGSSMGKSPVELCRKLTKICDIPIFWLTMTFFPGETLETLNKTGNFLRKHGFNPEELYGRVRTNGTEGGLGQFFQLYEGTITNDIWKDLGVKLTSRPMRLLPSFLPFSFLDCKIEPKRNLEEEDFKWFDMYSLQYMDPYFKDVEGLTIKQAVGVAMKQYHLRWSESATYYAICARLGII